MKTGIQHWRATTAQYLRRLSSTAAAALKDYDGRGGGGGGARASKKKLAPLQERKMVDKFRIHVQGGHGGTGCTSFRKGRQSRHGFADGGNGGCGGDVILVGSSAVWDLSNLQHHLNGRSGGQGSSKKKVGSRGVDKIVQVPVGTVIHFVRGTVPSLEAAGPAGGPSAVFVSEQESDALEGTGSAARFEFVPVLDGGGQKRVDMLRQGLDDSEKSGSATRSTSAVLCNGKRGREGLRQVLDTSEDFSPVFGAGEGLERQCADSMGIFSDGTNQMQDFRPVVCLDSLRDEEESSSDDSSKSRLILNDLGSSRHNFAAERSPRSVLRNKQMALPDDEFESSDYFSDNDQEDEDEDEEKQEVQESVAEFTSSGQSIIVAQGGNGGKGNAAMARGTGSEKSLPSLDHEVGQPGSEADLILELKAIADVGLVGAPNAGKSTLLGALSRAKPLCGHYKFTTLRPNIGMVDFDDFYSLTVADIPGLLQGAHQNRGLGHAFLRHIERTKVLAYVVDLAGGLEFDTGPRPWDQFESLVYELEQYQAGLSMRPSVIVANKIDEEGASTALQTLRERVPHLEIYPVCAVLDEGVEDLKLGIRKLVEFEPGVEASALSRPREV